MAEKSKVQFVCQNRGYVPPKFLERYPSYGKRNTMVEEIEQDTTDYRTRTSLSEEKAKPTKIADVVPKKEPWVETKLEELNRVLGGGVVPGSTVLIGGDPGTGKSTLPLQVSQQLVAIGGEVLYVSGGESAERIELRAERLGSINTELYLCAETDTNETSRAIEYISSDYVTIDPIQMMMQPNITGVIGSVSQVREATVELLKIAKTNGIAIFTVGHVTKEGSIADLRMLEHTADTVLYFEGEQHHSFRILRAVKNRLGSTNEIGIFETHEHGLEEVANSSQIFLEEHLDGTTGSVIVVVMERTRPILAEIQALVTLTMFGNTKRTTTGLDFNHVSLIMAVLKKRAGLLLQNQDTYLKAAGGAKLNKSTVDLAIAISIISSYKEKGTQSTECFIGEIGLAGEIRRVSHIEQRVKEVQKLGFTKVHLPKNSLGNWEASKGVEIVGMAALAETLKRVSH